MTITVKHAKVSVVSDSANTDIIQPSDWNANLVTEMATGRLVGRTSSLSGVMEEIEVQPGLTLDSGDLSLTIPIRPTSNGANSAPTYSFSSANTTGMYWDTGDSSLSFSYGGHKRLSIGTGQTINFNGYGTQTLGLELGTGRTGDGITFVDFHAAAAADYNFRMIRNAGVNGTMTISNIGTGKFSITNGAGTLALNTNSADRLTIDSAGAATFSGALTVTGTFNNTGTAKLNVENQALTGGVTVTEKALGTLSTGTLTLDMGDRPNQSYTNNGAHTLAPGSVVGSCLVDITNGASAGAITTSGWTKVAGDSFTTTNAHKFRCHCSVGTAGSLLVVQAMQ